jgi:exodeoxyribonuclease V beta subunit
MRPEPFDPAAPLPAGRMAIEASAGTGKTYTLAALATRFVAERGIRASELLMVTFTRAAAAELRDRVRSRLTEAAGVLLEGEIATFADPVLAHLASSDRGLRADRLARAVTEFDSATITTIHGFATQVLGTLGANSATDPDATLVDAGQSEVAAACSDVLAWASTQPQFVGALPTYSNLVKATSTAKSIPDLSLAPRWGEEGAPLEAQVLSSLVGRSLATLQSRRREAGTLSFDDVLTELRRAIEGPGGRAVLAGLRSRFGVALIDEFQDTDPVQWSIFEAAFGDPASTTALVLVGDPKQAIYSFRGANVATYVAALADPATDRRSLEVNRRSDGGLLRALEVLFADATFGTDAIRFAPVMPAPDLEHRSLLRTDGAPWPPLTLHMATGPDIARKHANGVIVDDAVRAIAEDLVAHVIALLDGACMPDPLQPAGGTRALRPSDIAVLVRRNDEAAQFQAALRRAGVPAVLVRGTSVLESEAAMHWRWLLEALLRPTDPRRARTMAISWFGGWGAAQLAAAADDDLIEVQRRLGEWLEVLANDGVDALLAQVLADSGAVAKVLGLPDGDRAATDLGHVGDLLRAGAPNGRASIASLLAVLDAPADPEAEPDIEGSVRDRRIETESESVQIMTAWVAKGLEFPVVCCPTLWRQPQAPPVIFTEGGRRTFDVANGSAWPDAATAKRRKDAASSDAAGEYLRLAYVALTRARHATVMWWAKAASGDSSPLTRLLYARRPDGTIDPDLYGATTVSPPADDQLLVSLAPLIESADGLLAVSSHGHVPPMTWHDSLGGRARPELSTASFDVRLDRSSSRWSFTALSHGPEAPAAEPMDESAADGGAADEGPTDTMGAEGGNGAGRGGGALSHLAVGTAFGTLVHAVLEGIDFAAVDLEGEIRSSLGAQLARRPFPLLDNEGGDGTPLLVEGLSAVLTTALGAPFHGRCLAQIARVDRVDEMGFDLPLGGPEATTLRQMGAALRAHLPDDDPMAAWASRLGAAGSQSSLRGHLTGSIDLIVRVRDADGAARFVVIDYKTNQLTPWGAAASERDYDRSSMASAMREHDYPLQALLYSVALHRYLRWRLADYEPSVHLGGAAYLFLRGMTGPTVPVVGGHVNGVFDWAIPPAAVVEVSDLLAGRRSAEVPA